MFVDTSILHCQAIDRHRPVCSRLLKTSAPSPYLLRFAARHRPTPFAVALFLGPEPRFPPWLARYHVPFRSSL